MMLGGSMLLSLAIALYYGDGDALAFGISSAIIMLAGFLMYRLTGDKSDLQQRDGFAVVTLGWFAMGIAGALPFYISGAIPSITDSLFESLSGFTTTGASILTEIESLPHGILFWRSFTHWIGGMGIIVFSIAILPFLGVGGMQMFKAESPGPTADKLTPRIRGTAEILWGVYVAITVLEIVLLRFGGMGWFDSACHAFGTLATGGFSTKNASIAYYDSSYIHWIIILFMYLAGVNFSLHFYAIKGKPKKYLQSAEFRFFTSLLLIAIAIMTLLGLLRGESFLLALRDSAFQAVSISTTTGYATADFELWQPLAQFILVSLMLVGGMAGSTGGGMKAIRVMIFLKQAKVELHKMVHPESLNPLRVGKKVVSEDIVSNVLAFIMLYMLILIASTLFMAALGLDLVTAVTSVIACLSNIGPGLGDIGPTENFASIPLVGKWLLTFLMVAGRLEIYTVLVLFTKTFWQK